MSGTPDFTVEVVHTVDVADVAVALTAGGRARSAAVRAATAAMTTTDRPADVEVVFGRQAPPRPAESWHHADGDIRLWWTEGRVVIAHGGITAHVEGSAAEIGGRGDLERAFRQMLPYLLTHLLADLGRFVLHAGAVARHGGAILVLGPTGSGKSTVAVTALGDGWSVLGDDLVAVRAGPAGPEVRGVGKPLLAPERALRAADVAGHPVEGDSRGRWEVTDHERDERWHRVAATAVSAWGSGGAGLRALSSQELIEWLLFSFLAARDDERLCRYLPVAAAITRCGGSELAHGEGPPRPDALLDGLLERSGTGLVGPGGGRTHRKAAHVEGADDGSSEDRPDNELAHE